MGLEWNDQRYGEGWDQVRALAGAGLAVDRRTMGSLAAEPTYVGVVRATEERAHVWREKVAAAVADGESTNLDFKRELNVGRNAEKAEFVRDALGLANTKSPGARYLIIGLDDAGKFYAAPPIDLTCDRLQQVLNGWCSSPPELHSARVPWQQGEVAVIEVVREPMKLAYVATKSSGSLKAGIVYVRHGPHTEPASGAEAASLEMEGERARSPTT